MPVSDTNRAGAARRTRKPQPAPHAAVPSRPLVLAPRRTGVFAQARPSAPTLGQRQAAQRVQQARRANERNIAIAPAPKLAHPTQQQRQAAKEMAVRALGQQGIHTRAQVNALPVLQRQRANRLLGYTRTLDKYHNAAFALARGYQPKPGDTVRSVAALGQRMGLAAHQPLAASRGDRKLGGGSLLGVVHLPTVNVDAVRRGILGATSLQAPTGENAWVKNSLSDIAGLGTAPLIGGLELEQGLTEAGKSVPGLGSVLRAGDNLPVVGPLIGPGHGTARLQRLGKGLVQSVKQDAAVQLLTGHPGRAAEALRQHPIYSLLDVGAAESIAGRAAGAVARGVGAQAAEGGLRGGLARVGSRVRPPIAHVNEPGAAYTERTGSGSLFRSAAQAVSDRTRKPVRDAQGRVVMVQDRGRQVPLLQPRSQAEANFLQHQRADFMSDRANARERLGREQAGHGMSQQAVGGHVRGRIGKRGQAIIDMVTRGVLRPNTAEHPGQFLGDVDKRIASIDKALQQHRDAPAGKSPYHHKDEVADAEKQLAALKAFRGSPRAQKQVEHILTNGRAIGRELNAQEAEGMRLRTLEPEAERARLMDYAMAHMDAKHVTEQDHARLEKAAQRVEDAARARVDAAPKGSADRARALEDWRKARRRRAEVSGKEPGAVVARSIAANEATAARRAHHAAAQELQAARLESARVGGRAEVRGGVTSIERLRAGQQAPNRAHAVLSFIDRAMKDTAGTARGAQLEKTVEEQRAAVQQRVERARARERSTRQARLDAEQRLAALPEPKRNAGLRNADATFLSNDAIKAHMREHGVNPDEVAFVSHREHGNEAFHARFDQSRPNLGAPPRRTGAAFARGSEGHGPEQLVGESVRKATRNVKASEIDQAVRDNGMLHPAMAKLSRAERDQIAGAGSYRARLGAAQATGKLSAHEARVAAQGGYFTPREALEITRAHPNLVAFRAYGGSLSGDSQSLVRDLQHPKAAESFPGQLINDRIVRGEINKDGAAVVDGQAVPRGRRETRNIVLMSQETVNRLVKQAAPAGELERFAQALNVPFRVAVLAQPRWLAGNFIEPYFVRLPAVGSGFVNIPGMGNDIRIATKAVKQLERSGDPASRALAEQIRAQQFGGLFIGGRGASVRRRAQDSQNLLARRAAFMRDLPVVKQMGDLLSAVPRAYFFANRQAIEQWAQRATFGKSLRRDMQEISGSWIKAMRSAQPALEDALKGLQGTPAQERFMRYQYETLGKYGGYSPKVRRAIQTLAPFLPWALSAARFVYWTMPRSHTALTAFLVKSQQVFNQEWQDQHQTVKGLDGGLKYALPTKDGGFVDVGRYTPYGFTAPIIGGDLQGITDQFFPQLSGPIAAIGGKDPFGRDLQVPRSASNPTGKPNATQRLAIALYGLAESTLGPASVALSTARRLQEHGGTAYANSTAFAPRVKPGTSHGMSALQRTYDPFRPTYLRSGASSSFKGGGNSVQDFLRESGVGQVAPGATTSSDEEFVLQALSGR